MDSRLKLTSGAACLIAAALLISQVAADDAVFPQPADLPPTDLQMSLIPGDQDVLPHSRLLARDFDCGCGCKPNKQVGVCYDRIAELKVLKERRLAPLKRAKITAERASRAAKAATEAFNAAKDAVDAQEAIIRPIRKELRAAQQAGEDTTAILAALADAESTLAELEADQDAKKDAMRLARKAFSTAVDNWRAIEDSLTATLEQIAYWKKLLDEAEARPCVPSCTPGQCECPPTYNPEC